MNHTSSPTPSSLLARAIAIAAVAHERQLDKAGAPYMLHPIRMMMRANTDDERIVAILHDVVEDSEWTLDELAADGFPPHILAGIDGMTNRDGESYEAFIERAGRNPISARVKLLDLEDNMTITRLSEVTDKSVDRLKKYHRSYLRMKEIAGE